MNTPFRDLCVSGSSTWASRWLRDGSEVGSRAVSEPRANLEPLVSRSGTVSVFQTRPPKQTGSFVQISNGLHLPSRTFYLRSKMSKTFPRLPKASRTSPETPPGPPGFTQELKSVDSTMFLCFSGRKNQNMSKVPWFRCFRTSKRHTTIFHDTLLHSTTHYDTPRHSTTPHHTL